MVKIKFLENTFKEQIIICLCINLGQIISGFTVGWSAVVIPKLQDLKQSPLPEPIALTIASWVASSTYGGFIIGPCACGYMGNKFGRKITIISGGLIFIVSQIVLALARNLIMIYIGRILNGFSCGVVMVANLVYIGEMASPRVRGMMLSSTGVNHCLGWLLVTVVGPFVSYPVIGYIFMIVGVVHISCIMYIPESPVFWLMKGHNEQAITTLKLLGRANEIEEWKTAIENNKNIGKIKWNWKELVTVKSNRKSFMIILPMFFVHQWCGIVAVLMFTTNIFQGMGSSIDPSIATMITGVIQLIGTIIVVTIIEHFGRKTLMSLSTAGCCLSMAVISIYYYLESIKHYIIPSIGWVPVVGLVASVFSYSIGITIIPLTLMGEIFCPNVRSIGSAISKTVSNCLGFLVVTSFGYLTEAFGSHVVFGIYAVVNFGGFLHTLFCVPETKGMSLIEIQNLLAR